MSRSLGDDIAHSIGVIATPTTKTLVLSDRDLFLIVASDGVWDGLDNQDVAAVMMDCDGDVKLASRELVKASLEALESKALDDNVTNVCLYLK